VAGDRDTVELYLEGMPLPPERLEGLAREVEGVFRPCTGQVRRRAHSRRASGKATPPHGRWGGVGTWRSLAQGEVRMVPSSPTAMKRPFP